MSSSIGSKANLRTTWGRINCSLTNSLTEQAYTYIVDISDEPVTYNGDRTLPERLAVEIVVRVERGPQHGKAQQGVQVEYDEPEYGNPQQ